MKAIRERRSEFLQAVKGIGQLLTIVVIGIYTYLSVGVILWFIMAFVHFETVETREIAYGDYESSVWFFLSSFFLVVILAAGFTDSSIVQ